MYSHYLVLLPTLKCILRCCNHMIESWVLTCHTAASMFNANRTIAQYLVWHMVSFCRTSAFQRHRFILSQCHIDLMKALDWLIMTRWRRTHFCSVPRYVIRLCCTNTVIRLSLLVHLPTLAILIISAWDKLPTNVEHWLWVTWPISADWLLLEYVV